MLQVGRQAIKYMKDSIGAEYMYIQYVCILNALCTVLNAQHGGWRSTFTLHALGTYLPT